MTEQKGYVALLHEVLQMGADGLDGITTEEGRHAVRRINEAIEKYLAELGFSEKFPTEPRFKISERPAALGGGWTLKLYQGYEEMGGGVFPPDEAAESPEQALLWAYNDAAAEGDAWVQSRQE